MLKNSDPSSESLDIPLITDLRLEIKPLTTTLWLQPSNKSKPALFCSFVPKDIFPVDLIQPIPCPLNSLLFRSITFQSRDKNVMWDHLKGLAEVQVDYIMIFCCLLMPSLHHRTPEDLTRLIWHNPSMVKLCWLSWITSLFCMSLKIPGWSRRICSMIFPRTEVKLTSLYFLESSFLSFIKMGVMFPFSCHWGHQMTTMTIWIWWRVAWPSHHPVPSGLWDAFHWVPYTCTCLVSADGLEPALFFQWKEFCSPNLRLEVQGCERHRKSDCQWGLRQRTHWIPRPLPCPLLLFLLSHVSEVVPSHLVG